MGDLLEVCGVEEEDRVKVEKMTKVALWCVQHSPEGRPSMSMVVKMLEGDLDIPTPSNHFQYFTRVSIS